MTILIYLTPVLVYPYNDFTNRIAHAIQRRNIRYSTDIRRFLSKLGSSIRRNNDIGNNPSQGRTSNTNDRVSGTEESVSNVQGSSTQGKPNQSDVESQLKEIGFPEKEAKFHAENMTRFSTVWHGTGADIDKFDSSI